ncbi:MAG: aminotransferase class V-fold PLP-dependent enzyme, partial [Verrucomicrobiae bacterium]|nr:aminotransferase class V-fold PLP-dependent enzyme [Verrucomicrobiae bacterium]
GCRVTYLPVNRDGLLKLADLENAITDDTAVVSLMWANNETGVLFPVREIAELCRSRGVLFHCDAVQAAGKVEIDVRQVPADCRTDLREFERIRTVAFNDRAQKVSLDRAVAKIPEDVFLTAKHRRSLAVEVVPVRCWRLGKILKALLRLRLRAEETVVSFLHVRPRHVLKRAARRRQNARVLANQLNGRAEKTKRRIHFAMSQSRQVGRRAGRRRGGFR